jgi:hypothetical protein
VPRRRVADVGDFGFIVFAVDETAGLIHVFDLVGQADAASPSTFGHWISTYLTRCSTRWTVTKPPEPRLSAAPNRVTSAPERMTQGRLTSRSADERTQCFRNSQ